MRKKLFQYHTGSIQTPISSTTNNVSMPFQYHTGSIQTKVFVYDNTTQTLYFNTTLVLFKQPALLLQTP